jgi:quercetin dioxygenase-like cupin family protein/DNA-binding Xre family transcriptional regulator
MATDILQEQLAIFGVRLKELRHERRWTLDDLAQQSGFSKGYLSRLESGDRQASIASVLTLARLFGASVASMFEGENAEPLVIIRREGTAAHHVNGLTCWPLSAKTLPFQLQPMRVIVSPHREGDEHRHHDGEEWIYLISGELTLSVGGKTYELEAGDAAHFDARLPHRLMARGGLEAEVLLVAAPGAKPTGPPRPRLS